MAWRFHELQLWCHHQDDNTPSDGGLEANAMCRLAPHLPGDHWDEDGAHHGGGERPLFNALRLHNPAFWESVLLSATITSSC